LRGVGVKVNFAKATYKLPLEQNNLLALK